jgi:hypothetical protein
MFFSVRLQSAFVKKRQEEMEDEEKAYFDLVKQEVSRRNQCD